MVLERKLNYYKILCDTTRLVMPIKYVSFYERYGTERSRKFDLHKEINSLEIQYWNLDSAFFILIIYCNTNVEGVRAFHDVGRS